MRRRVFSLCFCLGLCAASQFAAARAQGREQETRLYPVTVEGRYGFIRETGELAFMLPPEVYSVRQFTEGLAVVAFRVEGTRGRWGFVDESGRVVIPARFHHAMPFSEGLAAVTVSQDETSDGHIGYIDRQGRFAVTPRFVRSTGGDYRFSEGRAAVQSKDDMSWGYVDRTGAWVARPHFSLALDFSDGLALVAVGQTVIDGKYVPDLKYGFVDPSGRVVIPTRFASADSFSEGLAAFVLEEGGKVGYINTKGDVVIRPQFDDGAQRCGESFLGGRPGVFSEGLAAVRVGEQFGYIDRAGRIVITARYDCAAEFSGGLALVGYRTGYGVKFGYIDRAGKFAIEPRFSSAASFDGPLASVGTGLTDEEILLRLMLEKEMGKSDAEIERKARELEKDKVRYGYIDRTGKFVWQPTN